MAAPAFRANGAATSGSTGTTVTVNKPAGTTADDLLIAVVTNGGANAAPSTVPDGWTLRTSAGGTTWWAGVYYKIAGGAEPATYTWDGFTNSCTGCMIAVSGADTGDPIPVFNQQANINSNVACPGITPPVDECLIVAAAGVDDNQGMSNWAVTDPGVLTERAEQLSSGGDDTAAGIATGAQTMAAATGTLSATLAGTRDNSGFLLAVQPPQAGGGTVTGTATAQLGALSAVGGGDRTAHGAASLGGTFTAAAAGVRAMPGTAAASSFLASSGTGRRTVTGSVAAPLGGLSAVASGAGGTTGSATANLGGLNATAAGGRTANGTAAAVVGGLAAATGRRAVHGAVTGPLALTATVSGHRTVHGALLASLGGLTAAMVAANGSESGTAAAGAPATSTSTAGAPSTASATAATAAVPTATGGGR